MFPLISRCQVKSIAWFSPTSMVGSPWKERIGGNSVNVPLGFRPQNGEIGTDNCGPVGIGILPSPPTRNPRRAGFELVALHPLPPPPVALHSGELTLSV